MLRFSAYVSTFQFLFIESLWYKVRSVRIGGFENDLERGPGRVLTGGYFDRTRQLRSPKILFDSYVYRLAI